MFPIRCLEHWENYLMTTKTVKARNSCCCQEMFLKVISLKKSDNFQENTCAEIFSGKYIG